MAAVNKQPAAGGVAPWLEAPHDVELITRPELFLFAWLVDLVARSSTPGKSRDEVRNNLVQFKQRYLPARPPPDLLFAVYRLLVPKVRSGGGASPATCEPRALPVPVGTPSEASLVVVSSCLALADFSLCCAA